jgi:hypothetical protein
MSFLLQKLPNRYPKTSFHFGWIRLWLKLLFQQANYRVNQALLGGNQRLECTDNLNAGRIESGFLKIVGKLDVLGRVNWNLGKHRIVVQFCKLKNLNFGSGKLEFRQTWIKLEQWRDFVS